MSVDFDDMVSITSPTTLRMYAGSHCTSNFMLIVLAVTPMRFQALYVYRSSTALIVLVLSQSPFIPFLTSFSPAIYEV